MDVTDRSYFSPLHCYRCSYEWFPRGEALPKRCPSCRSVKWNNPHLNVQCLRCGHKWNSQNGSPVRCPGCGSKCWNTPPKTHDCNQCGRGWTSGSGRRPSRCPFCGSKTWDVQKQRPRKSFKTPETKVDPELERKIIESYRRGNTCVDISKVDDIPYSIVLAVVKKSLTGKSVRV